MLISHGRPVRYSFFILSIVFAMAVLFLSSCSANLPVQHETRQTVESTLSTNYSIVCVIHGDGEYLYHDTSGNEYNADQEALAGAISVARQNPHAEVFIFHQRPRHHFLFFFPLPDGDFYFYRNGQLIEKESYRRNQEKSNLDPETALYRQFSVDNQRKKIRIFLYFGHEIPEFGGAGYDESYPDRAFNINEFVNGLKGFAPDSEKFDLLILSTCFGGTPYTIEALGSISRTIIASPGYLHLSYFGLRPLERLDIGLRDGDVPSFANRFAQQAFDRLIRNVQTEVSVAVYNVDSVQKYLHSIQGVYERSLITEKRQMQNTSVNIEHCDCADLPAYIRTGMNSGVEVFYRPARFGRTKNIKQHSGWECRKEEKNSVKFPYATKPVLK